ncbi:MAG: hypothetical protein KA185_18055, partial [Vitreoscilla sp.]|nr:hypothetical protein [Vitreoscilla sp.]
MKRYGPALEHLGRFKALSRSIDDLVGIGVADMSIARVLLAQGALKEALPVLDEAKSLLEPYEDGGANMTDVMELRILALARLKRPEVLTEI